MPSLLRYGQTSVLELDVPPESLVAACKAPRGEPLDDPAAAVSAALDEPLDYPPLKAALVPGDRVAVALDPELPEMTAVVGGVVETLRAGGVRPEEITLVLPAGSDGPRRDDPRDGLPAESRAAVGLERHDPRDRGQLRYLAVDALDESIYVNRAVHDADLVLPVGCLRHPASLDHFGMSGDLLPALCDEATHQRLTRAPAAARRAASEKLAWLLGTQLAVEIVPAAAGHVLQVLAGHVAAVESQGRARCAAAWGYRVPRRAQLVVATIEGGPSQQTWTNVARALAAAGRVVAPDGAVALCTELEEPPGPALTRLAEDMLRSDADRAPHATIPAGAPDATAAAEVVEALRRGSLYLLSRLDEETVEGLGIAPVAGPEQIARLTRRFESCTLLGNAHYAVAEVEEEPEEVGRPA